MSPGLQALPRRQTAVAAVDVMELLYRRDDPLVGPRTPSLLHTAEVGRPLREELRRMSTHPDRPTMDHLARWVWDSAVVAKRPTAWCFRRFDARLAIVRLVFGVAGSSLGGLLRCGLSEDEFTMLTLRMGEIAGSRVSLYRVPTRAAFAEFVAPRFRRSPKMVVVCDWRLSAGEKAVTRRSGLRVLAPGGGRRRDRGSIGRSPGPR